MHICIQLIETNLSTEFDAVDDKGYLAIIKYNRKKRKYREILEQTVKKVKTQVQKTKI